MKKLFILSLLFFAFNTYAQEDKGMHFVHGSTWAEIKAQAKKQHKYIFVDAFTTWCGPCKYMSANIFPMEDVGAFFNAHFINVKVQIDSTKADGPEVQKWYADAHNISKAYKIMAYPTYLFFSPEGELVHRSVGASDAAAFISKGKDAMDPQKQYYTLKKKYEAGKKDPAFLLLLANASREAYDFDFLPVITNQYLATQSDLTTPENIRFLSASTKRRTDPGFNIFKTMPEKADSVLGKGVSASILKDIAMREIVYPALYTSRDQEISWDTLQTRLEPDFSEQADEILLSTKAMYYQSKKNWPEFYSAVSSYMGKYGDKLSNMEINNFAWMVFQNCEDGACVETALEWSKRTLSGNDEKNPTFMDTYANLLYKAGRKEEAVKLEEEAARLGTNDPNIAAALEKMKKGEKTW